MLKLLIVDDERFTREGLYHEINWKTLNIAQVKLAENGVSALNLTNSFVPDILLTDVKMPKMNGIELAYEVKEINPNCSIIFMSGYSDKEFLMSAIQINALNYVEKPLNINEVIKTLKKAISEQRSLQKRNRFIENDMAIRLSKKISEQYQSDTYLDKFIPKSSCGLNMRTIVLGRLSDNLFLEGIDYDKTYQDLKKELNDLGVHSILGFLDNKYIIVHLFYESIEKHHFIKKFIQPIYECIVQLLGDNKKLYLGLGKPVHHSAMLYKSYDTAMTALKNSFFLPHEHIHIYRESQNNIESFDTEMISKFSYYINSGDQENAIEMVKQIKENLCTNPNIKIDTTFNIFFNLFIELEKSKDMSNILEEDILDIWNLIYNAKSIVDLEKLLISEINEFFAHIRSLKSDPVVSKIISIIEEKYSDVDLSLNTISDDIYMSPSYICVLFKKETNKTIIQYINEFRIERSLELLRDKRYRINDIADMVGFSSSNYYSKTFKKIKGVSPNEYRKRFFNA